MKRYFTKAGSQSIYCLPATQLSHYLRGYSQNGPRQRPGSLQSITNVFMPGSGLN